MAGSTTGKDATRANRMPMVGTTTDRDATKANRMPTAVTTTDRGVIKANVTPTAVFTIDRDVLLRALSARKPQVKFLVNAAGFGMIGQVEELGLKSETDMVALNCEALCAVTRMVLPYMECNSRIIQYASSAAFLPQPGFAIYAATKSFVLSYSRALNQELRSRRIYVTAVCPGPVKTEFFDIAESTGVIPLYKRLVMANPKRVVQKAIRDSIAGREISVYGITMKAFRLLCKMMPHRLLLAVMSFMNE